MNFTTPVFLIYFFPVVLILYLLLPVKFRNLLLILASCLFYFWGEGNYLFLLYIWIGFNFVISRLISKYKKNSAFFLILAVVGNLGVLVYFKYTGFILESINLKNDLNIYLPLAISFLTFHAISYNIDIFKKISKPESNFFRLALYFTFFPHLIAGPIIRYHEVSKQLANRIFNWREASEGIYRFVIGLSKKILIANTLAPIADEIFAIGPSHLSLEQAWFGVFCFALQIYYDFSGYTDMAIGLGLVFGFKFPENFNHPYAAKSITEFWRRWHMTLARWFRDYVYIPLGGNRKGQFITYINLTIVFILLGLWHGAALTFAVWGLIQAFFLIVERFRGGLLLNILPRFLRHIYVILAILISWVFFRSDNISEALGFLKLMFSGQGESPLIYYSTNYFLRSDVLIAILFGVIFAMPVFQKLKVPLFILFKPIVFLMLLFLSLVFIAGGSYQSFIYFRF